MQSCGRDSTFTKKKALSVCGLASVLKFSRCIRAMVTIHLTFKQIISSYSIILRIAEIYVRKISVSRDWIPAETPWFDSGQGQEFFPSIPRLDIIWARHKKFPGGMGRSLRYALSRKHQSVYPHYRGRKSGIKVCETERVQEQSSAHAHSYPPVPPTHDPQLLLACP
jgi:hypothetical protein